MVTWDLTGHPFFSVVVGVQGGASGFISKPRVLQVQGSLTG